jgi:hypothetical protein
MLGEHCTECIIWEWKWFRSVKGVNWNPMHNLPIIEQIAIQPIFNEMITTPDMKFFDFHRVQILTKEFLLRSSQLSD